MPLDPDEYFSDRARARLIRSIENTYAHTRAYARTKGIGE